MATIEVIERERALKVIEGAQSLLEQGWCQRNGAKDAQGVPCVPSRPYAVEWCINGALDAASRFDDYSLSPAVDAVFETISSYPDFVPYGEGVAPWHKAISIATWNDAPERTQEEVVFAIVETIERLQGES